MDFTLSCIPVNVCVLGDLVRRKAETPSGMVVKLKHKRENPNVIFNISL